MSCGGDFMYHLQTGKWLQTDLHTLLPDSQHYTKIQLKQINIKNSNLISKLLHWLDIHNQEVAFTLAEKVAEQWQKKWVVKRYL